MSYQENKMNKQVQIIPRKSWCIPQRNNCDKYTLICSLFAVKNEQILASTMNLINLDSGFKAGFKLSKLQLIMSKKKVL